MIDSVKAGSHEVNEGSTIRVVSSRTGLPMETLRAWERRHGFPKPERRAGSNRRLYSAMDVDRLLAIKDAIARGYRIGDVIGKSIADIERLADVAEGGVTRTPPPPTAPTGSASAVSIPTLIDLLARDRVTELERQLRHAAAMLGPADFVTSVAHPFAVGVGDGWASGKLSIRHEHLATECLVTQIRLMLASYQDMDTKPLVLLATLPGESHTLPLQMVALYLVSRGAKPRLLGGSSPPSEIAQAVRALGADAVGLTVTPTCDQKNARTLVRALRKQLPEDISLWLGGQGAAALRVARENVRIVDSWEGIDAAVDACKGKDKGRGR